MSPEREMAKAGLNFGAVLLSAVGLAHNYGEHPWWMLAWMVSLLLNAWQGGKMFGRALQLRRW